MGLPLGRDSDSREAGEAAETGRQHRHFLGRDCCYVWAGRLGSHADRHYPKQ